MKYLKSFKESNGYINPRIMDRRPPQFIGDIKQSVEIRIDVEAIGHALSRQYRHGVTAVVKLKQKYQKMKY